MHSSTSLILFSLINIDVLLEFFSLFFFGASKKRKKDFEDLECVVVNRDGFRCVNWAGI